MPRRSERDFRHARVSKQCSLNTCRKSRFVRLDTPKILSKVPEKTGRILVSGPPPACLQILDLGFYLRPAASGKEPVGSTFQYSIHLVESAWFNAATSSRKLHTTS